MCHGLHGFNVLMPDTFTGGGSKQANQHTLLLALPAGLLAGSLRS